MSEPESVKPLIYIETTIPGYLVANPSKDMTLLYHQIQTREWWTAQRHDFQPVISPEVTLEISRGDQEMAQRRMEMLVGIPELTLTEPVIHLNKAFAASRVLPVKAASDILHLAFAAGHGCQFLLTWNCRHINNPYTLEKLRKVCERQGFGFPAVTTPTTLLGVPCKPDELD